MKKIYTLFLAVLLIAIWNSTVNAQCNPAPCQGPPSPEPNAQDACALSSPSDLDCYFGATFNSTPVSFPPSWCTTIENNHFFAFTADAVTEIFEMCTYGCAQGGAIQAAVLSTADCIDFNFVSPCLGNIATGTCQDLVASNLVIGEVYYLMIDGSAGALCDYSINGVNPTINGPNSAPCLPSNLLSTYNTNTTSNWTINPPTAGNIQGNANGVTSVDVQWIAPGQASVCATSTVCPNAPELCIDIYIGEDVTSQEDIDVCQGQSVECAGVNHSTAGNHFVTLQSWLGCDSVVNCFVTIIPTVFANETHRMCQGGSATCAGEEFFAPGTFPVTLQAFQGCDSIVRCTITVVPTFIGQTKFVNLCHPSTHQVCDETYDVTGIYSTKCTGFLGCDSIVNIDLAIMNPIAKVSPPGVLDCGPNQIITLNSTGSNLNNATAGITLYEWTGPGIVGPNNLATAQVNQPGEYCLILKHGRGGVYCADTVCVTVTASATPPGATATGGNINCVSSTAQLMGSSSTGGVTYTWAGPGITPTNQFQQNPVVNAIGDYVLTVFSPANGCTSTATVTVSGDNTPPTVSAVGDTITCFQPNVTIDGITNALTPTWNWAGPGINAGNQMVENPNVLLSGTYTVTVTNTVNGCTSTATTAVTINNSNPTVAAGPNDTLTCSLPNITLQGSGDAGGQPITFSWTGPNGFMSNIAQPNIDTAGTYILTVLNTLNGCLKKDTVVISVNQVLPNANAGADSIINCVQPSVFLIGTASSNGANFTATWSGPGINAGNMNLYNPEVNLPGSYNLLITNTANGCTATDQVLVDINTNLPSASAGTDQQLTCTTPNGVTLSGSGTPGSVTYLWSGPGIGSDNEADQNPVVTQTGTYDLVVTDPVNGCTATDQVIVTQDANIPTASGGPDQVLNCSVISVDFNGSASTSGPGVTYTWTGPGISGANSTAQSPTGLTVPGTYNLTVTNTNNNCVNTDVVIIEIDTIQPNADAGNALILNCFNNATDTLDASGSSLGSIFNVLWSGPGINAGNQNLVNPIINNQSGTYFLTVTNTDNNCTSTDQVDVTLDLAAPTADAGTDQIIDCVVTATVIGGSSTPGANFTYLWTGPSIDASNESLSTPTVDQAGTYTIVVTDNINGCTATDNVLVTSNAVLPTALAGNDGLLTCANPTTVLDGSGSSTGANFQVLWTGPGINPGNQNLPSPSVSDSGTYIIRVVDIVNSCVTFDTVLVAENTEVPAASAGLDLILNCQIVDVTIDGSQSDVSPTIVYNWAGPGINAGNQDDQSPLVILPGTYDLTVTDTENGCTSTDQAVVDQDIAVPTASAGVDGLITCGLQTETLDGSGSSAGPSIVYIWEGPGINSNNVGLQSPTVTAAGTYTVTVTNTVNLCTATDVVIVDLDENAPAINAGADGILNCNAATAQLDATQSAPGPNISFSWSGPGILPGNATSATPTVNLPGDYTLTITDSNNGCTSTDIANVAIDTISPLVFAGSDLTITCANAASGVTLSSMGSSTGANFSLLWSGPGITPANETSPDPTVLLPGTYTLLISNTTNGCTKTDVAVVDTEQGLPTAVAGPDQVITCSVIEAILDGSGSISPSGGSLTYLWAGPGIDPINQDEVMPVVLVSGTYSLTVTNVGNGCSATDVVIVSLDTQPPAATASSTQITCIELLSNLAATSTLTGSTYLWAGPGINPGNETQQTLQVDLAGLYNVTVTAPNGCTGTTSTLVTQDADVPDGLVNGTVLNCLNGGVSQIGGEILSPSGATATWTGPGIGTVTTPTATVTQAGTYTFTISAPNGCVRPFTALVVADFDEPVVVAAAADVIDCNTSEVTINATGSSVGSIYTFSWTTANGNFVSGINTLTPLVDQAGQYTLSIIDETNGCSATATANVLVDPAVPSGFNLTVNNVRCFGDVNGSIAVNGVQGGTPPFIYSLVNSTGTSLNQYTGLQAGQYVLSLQDGNGCKLDTTITVGAPGELTVALGLQVLGSDSIISLGDYVTITSQIESTVGVSSATWNYAPNCIDSIPYCETFTYLPFDTYRHRLTVVDNNGCEVREEILVVVRKNRQVYVPNVFDPNSAENYVVTVFAGKDVAKINSFFIFDRWGDQVFEQLNFLPNDFSKGWNGTAKGQPAQLGVYVWYCEVEFIDGEVKLFKGDVTLVR